VLSLVLSANLANADVHLIVGTPEQGGQYATVQAAVDAVPANNTERHVIDVKPGIYMARLMRAVTVSASGLLQPGRAP
jgi:pectin methylesterase-like acyl-CoA thioesterase